MVATEGFAEGVGEFVALLGRLYALSVEQCDLERCFLALRGGLVLEELEGIHHV